MIIGEALQQATAQLKKKAITSAALDAEVLLSFVLHQSKEYLFANMDKPVNAAAMKKLDSLIKRRSRFEPLAYLVGHKEFFGLDFFVNKNVLIPRPETELLVEETLRLAQKFTKKKVVVADIGTGSGCIAIALAKNQPKYRLYATDISTKALEVAKKNCRQHNVSVTFFHGYLFNPVGKRSTDIVVANLPYLKKEVYDQRYGLRYEPTRALYSRQNGLGHYRVLFSQLNERKHSPKFILCEIDPRQTRQIKKIAGALLPDYQIEIKKDLARRDRVVILTRQKTNVSL